MNPDDIDLRLASLEARTPVRSGPPALATGRRRRLFAPLILAPFLVVAVVATAVAGSAIVGNLTRAYPGVENPGQPLAGANLECMTPPAAAAYLTAHGFTNVVWQVESRSSGAKGIGTTGGSAQQATAPEHGFVIPGSIVDSGQLIMVVDQRAGASGVGACAFGPMP